MPESAGGASVCSVQLETDAKFRIAVTAHFLAKPQHGGGGHAGGLGQLADGHVHHLILVFADVGINHQLGALSSAIALWVNMSRSGG